MADRKVQIAIETVSTQLKSDLTAIAAQFTQLNQSVTTFNTALAGTNGVGAGLSDLVAQFEKLAKVSGGFTAKLNSDLLKAAIAENTLTDAEIRKAKAILDTITKQEKAAQATANRQAAEEKLAITQQNLLKATAQREAAELRLAKASEQSNKAQVSGLKDVFKGIQRNLFAINNLRYGIESFGRIANGIFQGLVGSSIQLEQQLISIRGALAATNDITSGGKSIADPLERINKLAPSVNKAIAQVRKDSIELANVTSDDLIGVFQIISGEVGNIGANLDDAAKLTKAFGSSFSALGLPLAGARQEITSILQGTIDQNSALAKTLAINNTQIQQEKAKGTLVGFLLKKTEALAASQGLVAKTFGGVSSNILEVVQRLQESFGKVVLPPVVAQLTKIYESLLAAQPQIELFISNLTSGLVAIASQVGTVLSQFIPTIQGLFTAIGAIAQTSVPLLSVALNGVLLALSGIAAALNATIVPLLEGLGQGAGLAITTIGVGIVAVNSLSAAFTALTIKMGFIAVANGTIIDSFLRLIQVIKIQLIAAINGANTALTAFLANPLLLPVLAAAAATMGLFYINTENAKKTVEAWANSVNQTEALTKRFIDRFQELQDLQKKGTINIADRKKLEEYQNYLKQQVVDIKKQIAEIQKNVDDNKVFLGFFKIGQAEADEQKKRLEQVLKDIEAAFDQTEILGQKAINQGTLKAQFNTVSKNYFDEFRKGTQLAVGQAKQFIGVIEQEISLGFISKEEGLKRLKALSQGEFLLKEDRVAAAKAATAIVDTETKKQTALIQAFQSETQLTIARGLLSEIDGVNKLGELKAREKQTEIDGINEKLKYVVQGSELERDLLTQRKKAIADLAKSEIDFVKEQITALRGGLDRELSANADIRKKAEQATQADILALKLGGFENENQLQEQSLLIKKQGIESEIADTKRKIEFEETALTNSNLSQKEREEANLKIDSEKIKLSQLQLDATENLISRVKVLYDQKVKILEIEKTTSERVTQLLQSQNSLLAAQSKLQTTLIDAQLKGAENSLTVLQQSYENAKSNREKLDAQETASNDQRKKQFRDALLKEDEILGRQNVEKRKAQFEAEDAAEKSATEQAKVAKQASIDREKQRLTTQRLAELGISAGQNELDIARQIYDQEQKILELKARRFELEQAKAQRELEIQIQQSQIRDRDRELEGKIVLTKAKASGKTEDIQSALELNALIGEQVKNNKQIFDLQRQTLGASQAAERSAFNQEQGNAAFKSNIAGADAGLTGLQSSDRIKARSFTNVELPTEADARKKLADASSPENVKKVQDQRKKDVASVADGAVAFKDTSQQVANNFASLPNSLQATKAALQEVIGKAVELSENPIFKDREQQAVKRSQAKQQLTQQSAQKTQITSQVDREAAAIANANAQITARNAEIAGQNKLGTAANTLFSGNNKLNSGETYTISGVLGIGDNSKREAQLRREFPDIDSESLSVLLNNDPSSDIYKSFIEKLIFEQDARDKKNPNYRRNSEQSKAIAEARSLRLFREKKKINRFIGGYAPSDVPVTVNERGQEAVTNLQTLETSLLPHGERTMQFETPVWVHNAGETQQIRNLGMLDRVELPDISFKAIASTLRIDNSALLQEVQKQNKILTHLTDVMRKPNQYNTFNNDPRPDLTSYRLANELMRI